MYSQFRKEFKKPLTGLRSWQIKLVEETDEKRGSQSRVITFASRQIYFLKISTPYIWLLTTSLFKTFQDDRVGLLGEDLALEKRQMELESEFEVAKADTLTPAEAKVQQGQEEWNALMSKFENLKERKNQIIQEDENIETRSSALRKKVIWYL